MSHRLIVRPEVARRLAAWQPATRRASRSGTPALRAGSRGCRTPSRPSGITHAFSNSAAPTECRGFAGDGQRLGSHGEAPQQMRGWLNTPARPPRGPPRPVRSAFRAQISACPRTDCIRIVLLSVGGRLQASGIIALANEQMSHTKLVPAPVDDRLLARPGFPDLRPTGSIRALAVDLARLLHGEIVAYTPTVPSTPERRRTIADTARDRLRSSKHHTRGLDYVDEVKRNVDDSYAGGIGG